MTTYPLTIEDLNQARALHEKFYQDEFDFPDFSRRFLSTFKIVESGEVITMGGVCVNAELVLITDKEQPSTKKAFALQSALQIGNLVSKNAGHDLLYATVKKRDHWFNLLKSYGFKESESTHLFIG